MSSSVKGQLQSANEGNVHDSALLKMMLCEQLDEGNKPLTTPMVINQSSQSN